MDPSWCLASNWGASATGGAAPRAASLPARFPPVLVFTVADVIPGYWIYMRAEEEMHLAHLGDACAGYQQEVGMLVPGLRGARSGTPGADAE